MATITGLTAARMLIIEAESIVAARLVVDHLVLTKHDGTDIDVGSIRGAKGDVGLTGPTGGVTTVNGKTGTVNLSFSDVGAVPTTQFATESIRGILELASTTDIIARTDNTKAITPLHISDHPGIPYAAAAGSITIDMLATGNFSSSTIQFPPDRFSVNPIVTLSIQSAPNGSQPFITRAFSVGPTSATAAIYSGSFPTQAGTAFTLTVVWHAVQMSKTTAAG